MFINLNMWVQVCRGAGAVAQLWSMGGQLDMNSDHMWRCTLADDILHVEFFDSTFNCIEFNYKCQSVYL